MITKTTPILPRIVTPIPKRIVTSYAVKGASRSEFDGKPIETETTT